MSVWKQHRQTVALTQVGVTVVLGLLFLSSVAVPVFAQDPAPLVNFQPPSVPGQTGDLAQVINSVLQVVLVLIGFTATAMLVYGGLKFLLAGGDKEATAAARNTITYALLGFILAASIWTIFSLLGSFLGINLQIFNLAFP